jgi:uncharacterized protein YukE
VARREFPALGFDPAPGDPDAVSGAARGAGSAGRVLGAASASVTRLNSSGWTGEAAEAFRGQLKDLPRDLEVAARSYQVAARALGDFGSGLVGRQARAGELESRAEELRRQQAAAVGEVNRVAGLRAPQGSAELSRLTSQYEAAKSRADGLGGQLEQVLADARRLHAEHSSAARSAARAIRDVANAPYKEPGWLSRAWSSVKGWIADHADVLASISTVLKGVSAVLGVLSLVPGLQFLAPFAMAAAGAALLIDVALKVATGKGSWASIGIDAALTFIPGGKILSGLKGAKAAATGERALAAGERALASTDDLLRVPGALAGKGNPVSGLGSTVVHLGNGGNRAARRLFPELAGTNPLFRNTGITSKFPNVASAGFQQNCQSCVVAVDNQLAGSATSAVRRLVGSKHDIFARPQWRQQIAEAVGTSNTFQKAGSYDDIVTQLHNAGDGARGIVHGMRVNAKGRSVAGHVFNVVNRNGRIYFLDGQTGKFARLENFRGGLEFLRTH